MYIINPSGTFSVLGTQEMNSEKLIVGFFVTVYITHYLHSVWKKNCCMEKVNKKKKLLKPSQRREQNRFL